MTYFLGFVTGPRPEACPPGATGAGRFGFGVQASLWHELAIIATGAALVIATWGAANQVGTWTFLVVWWMRWSAKLNIFLGVRNLHVEFWPEHLRYLASYVHKASMNSLFPWTMIGSTFVVAALVAQAQGAGVTPFERTGLMLLASLVVLGALEHVFLLARVPDALLWRLATGERRAAPFSPELRSGQNP
jgi:putative photosynthetic complex assembly protein 2